MVLHERGSPGPKSEQTNGQDGDPSQKTVSGQIEEQDVQWNLQNGEKAMLFIIISTTH